MEFCWISLAGIAAIGGLAAYRAPFWAWSLAYMLSMGALFYGEIGSHLIVSWFSVIGALVIGFCSCPWLRRRYIFIPLLPVFKQRLPMMSPTEQAAIAAGDVWWEGVLFQGKPNWEKLLAFPKPELSEEELHFLNNQVEKLCAMVEEWPVSHLTLDLPKAVWDYLKQERFLGMIIPKEYGGLGFSPLAHSTIIQKIGTRSITAAITAMVPNSLGPAELLLRYGTEVQKDYYLKKLALGEEIPCFGLTSLEAGSDASAITDAGFVCQGEYEGRSVLGIQLTWNKRYITLAPVATVLGLAFKLYDPDKLLGGRESLGITVCLIPTKHPGVEIGLRHFPLNQTFLNGPTRGKNVFVPLDFVIGGVEMAGQGWQMLVECLSAGRGISLPALSASLAKISYRTTGAYSKIRRQFNAPIGHFEGIEAALAKIAGYTYLIEATRLFALTPLHQQLQPAIVSAIAKYHMTEMSRKVVNHAMDVHGGKAIMLGPNNYLGRCYESIPISITVEGANILTRNLIIFGQGAVRCHPYLQQEISAIQQEQITEGARQLDTVFWQHAAYLLSNIARAFFHALTGGRFCETPKETFFKRHYQQLTRLSVALSFLSDSALIILGGALKRRERLSARLGDVLSQLFLASAVLKYHHDTGNKKEDIPYVEWSLKTCLYESQEAIDKICQNFPIRLLGKIFRFILLPYGKIFCLPNDKLEHQLAVSMMQPSAFRDHLTQHCYLSHKNDNPMAHLDNTLLQFWQAEAIIVKVDHALKKGLIPSWFDTTQKIKKALELGILNVDEIEPFRQYEAARIEAIRVDEFSQEQLIGK
jgi:acyl-CoA dehydrogenase